MEPLTEVPEDMRELLENYSHISSEDVVKYVQEAVRSLPALHVRSVWPKSLILPIMQRDYIYAVLPWPCLGTSGFMDFTVLKYSSYDRILSELQKSSTLLDIGCGVAQGLRRLAHDGARTENMFGLERAEGLLDRSFDFFKDRDTFKGTLLCADFMDRDNADLKPLEGRFDFIQLSVDPTTFRTLEEQTAACVRAIEFSRPVSDALVMGEIIGRDSVDEAPLPGGQYRHDTSSFFDMWLEAARRTGTLWSVSVQTAAFGRGVDPRWDTPGVRRVAFAAERVVDPRTH